MMRDFYPLPRLLRQALRAAIALGSARIALSRIKPNDVIDRNRKVSRLTTAELGRHSSADITRHCDEAAFFINRMSARVPWRSDCLVQALAGQQWLAREGIASEIVVGTAKLPDGTMASHAWLRHGDRIVLGGDVTQFGPLLANDDETAHSGR